MRFYRVEFRADGGGSAGASFFTNRREAQREARAAVHQDESYYDDGPPEVESLDITPTRDGILRALNRWAGHPNNG